jgi:hypothetical protein
MIVVHFYLFGRYKIDYWHSNIKTFYEIRRTIKQEIFEEIKTHLYRFIILWIFQDLKFLFN